MSQGRSSSRPSGSCQPGPRGPPRSALSRGSGGGTGVPGSAWPGMDGRLRGCWSGHGPGCSGERRRRGRGQHRSRPRSLSEPSRSSRCWAGWCPTRPPRFRCGSGAAGRFALAALGRPQRCAPTPRAAGRRRAGPDGAEPAHPPLRHTDLPCRPRSALPGRSTCGRPGSAARSASGCSPPPGSCRFGVVRARCEPPRSDRSSTLGASSTGRTSRQVLRPRPSSLPSCALVAAEAWNPPSLAPRLQGRGVIRRRLVDDVSRNGGFRLLLAALVVLSAALHARALGAER